MIVLPTFAGLKATYNVLDLCMVQNKSEHLSLATNR